MEVQARQSVSIIGVQAKRLLSGTVGSLIPLMITLGAMMVIFSVLNEHFLQVANLLNIGRAIAIMSIVGLGTTIVLISGGIDLSVGAVMALSGLISAVLVRAGLPVSLGFVGALAAGLGVGLINGLIVTKLHINPLITTLAMSMIVRGLAYVGTGGHTLTVPLPAFTEIGRGRMFDIVPYPLILLVVTYVVVHMVLTRTLAGHYVYAIGGNPVACRRAGINVDRWRVLLYATGGAFAGFGGFLLASLVGAAMGEAALGVELDIIAGVILGGASLTGGQGTVVGTLLGMLILGTMVNGAIMLNISTFWQIVLRGVVLLLAVLVDAWRSGGYR